MIKKTALIELEDGRSINVSLDIDNAPLSVANFIKLAQSGFYKGLIFHRVIEDFMIQGGGFDIDMEQKKANTIKGEFESNGVINMHKHVVGTLSMARTMIPDSASSQFFICSVNTPHLDGSYAAFGQIEEAASLAVVKDISTAATNNYRGYSDVPKKPIIIKDIIITIE